MVTFSDWQCWVLRGDWKCKYGKRKYRGMECTSMENLSTIGKGGKCKYRKRKYRFAWVENASMETGRVILTQKWQKTISANLYGVYWRWYICRSETAHATSEHGWRNPASAVVRKVSQACSCRANGICGGFLIQRHSRLEMQLVRVWHLPTQKVLCINAVDDSYRYFLQTIMLLRE